MAPRLPQEARDLIDLARMATLAVDAVLTRFWGDVQRILRLFTKRTLISTDRLAIMRQIDRVIARVYGATQQAALISELFTTLVRVSDAAAETPFTRMLDRTRNLVERRSPGFWQRLRGRASTSPDTPFLRAMAAFDGPIVERQRYLRSKRLDPNRRWVNSDNHRLSDRVWRQGRDARRAIDARIVEGIRNGEDALDIAKDLERFLNPDLQPMTIRKDGKVVRRNQTRYPGRGGYGSYPARRLAQTEVNRALNLATHEAGKITPGAKGAKWNLSNTHEQQDRCDSHAAGHSPGMGRGEYTFDEFPAMPDHPMCRCFETIVTVSRDEMVAEFIAKYGGA